MKVINRLLFKVFDTYQGLPKSIYVLFFARIINSIGAFVYPFLTFFLTDKMGMGPKETGFYFLMVATMGAVGNIVGGYLSDHFGRKKVMVLFQGLSAFTFVPCAFLGNSMIVPWLLVSATFFGAIAQPANSAMVADLTNKENRKQSFALLYLGINIGFAVGPLLAGLLYAKYLKLIFLGDATTTIISLILVVLMVPESKPTDEVIAKSYDIETDERSEDGGLLLVLFRRPLLLAFAAVATIYSFVYVQHSFSIPIHLKELYGSDTGSKLFGTLMTTNGLVVVFLTSFVTKATLKLKPIQNIALSGVMCAIGFGMLYFSRIYPLFLISTVIWTIGEILNVTNSSVYIANHTPMTHRGRFNSILPLITGAGFAVGPILTGSFIETFSVKMVWPVVFALSMVGAILMYSLYLFEKRKKKGTQNDVSSL